MLNNTILIYTHKITKRLQYTMQLLFQDILQVSCEFTTDTEAYKGSVLPKFQYTTQAISEDVFFASKNLLFETGVAEHTITHVNYMGEIGLFKVNNPSSKLPFDPFAATFFLVTRYEEYLPFIEDKYGRFMPQNSVAYQLEFLNKPMVNIWALQLAELLKRQYPSIAFPQNKYKFIPTFDIDLAYAYRLKGPVRMAAGYFKSLSSMNIEEIKERTSVLLFLKKDPFDTYDRIMEIHKKHELESIFFFLFSKYGQYDKNVPIHNRKFHSLIKRMGDYVDVGIHPSFGSNNDSSRLEDEIKGLADVLNKEITKSRQHFLKVSLPETYRNLIKNDIQDDYTMGYASEPGFRASICIPFNFYDLDMDEKTKLKIHPFAFMDGTFRDYKDINNTAVMEQIVPLIRQVKQVKGTLYTVWHNESMSNAKRWKGWDTVYENLVKVAMP